MEVAIGEIFEYKGMKYKVVQNESCENCHFFNNECRATFLQCSPLARSDKKSVIFVKEGFIFGR